MKLTITAPLSLHDLTTALQRAGIDLTLMKDGITLIAQKSPTCNFCSRPAIFFSDHPYCADHWPRLI